MTARRWGLVLTFATVAFFACTGLSSGLPSIPTGDVPNDSQTASQAPTRAQEPPRTPAPGAKTNSQRIQRLLAEIPQLDKRPSPGGYDRDCGPEAGCVFGPAWTDDTAAPGGHNGCDTRNDLLRRDLREITVKPNTNGCVVLAGRLPDPYTGRTIAFAKERAHAVQVDHLVPLSLAWDLGAHAWSIERRKQFANDPANLLVVDGPTNASKGDSGPGEWMPINPGFRCEYVRRYLEVLQDYELPITRNDHAALTYSANGCQ